MIDLGHRISSFGPRHVIRGSIILTVLLSVGTMGYMVIEGWGFLDSLYMTTITVTTVGFGEVRSVSSAGRLFTIFIIFSGIGMIAYLLGIVAQAMVEFQLRSVIGRTKLGLKSVKV